MTVWPKQVHVEAVVAMTTVGYEFEGRDGVSAVWPETRVYRLEFEDEASFYEWLKTHDGNDKMLNRESLKAKRYVE